MNLDAYFARIGYTGPREPTAAVLRAVHRLHPQAIPFENLDPLRGVPVALDAAALEAKLVACRRGGYCYEQNLMFREVLIALGFRVRGLAARVVWNQPEGALTPRSHMLLRVAADGDDYLADVGFGGQVLTGPLRLDLRLEQATPHEPFRLAEAGGTYLLEAKLAGAWKALYRFDLHEHHPIDYVAVNYYLSTSPQSHFVSSLMAARTEPGTRYALRNTTLAIHRATGDTERRTLTSVRDLRDALAGPLAIAVPDDPALDAALARVVATATVA